ncbi:uncharacterized protein LOC123869986 isoform X2 [Maniola jurtina]|uniref:uncharacterized protein LOC123869986 isoform X2 n=1 Tax=Maniola jurtina TaxID=191418 RepID=UPI001E68D70C|nr:uncharacterized protein LOC123869986 isoform X2 [Maniola jurtina]
MLEIPECLSRRYKALDDLIQELKSSQPSNPNAESASTDDPGIKMMCDFWSILKEDPDVDLTQAVQQRMRANGVRSGMFGSQHVSCFRSGCCDNDDKIQKTLKKIKKVSNESPGEKSQCGTSKSATSSTMSQNNIPLNKVLCNLKEAASFEKKCHGKVNKLQERQKELQEQIQLLEQREKDGVTLLKQADCMWSCMEEAYKKKIAESLERQNDLLKQLKEAESSNVKWRKNKKDLEFQINIINKCYQEIQEKINEKTSDIKCINMEIENLKKRIESNKTDLEAAKKSFGPKKQASDAKMKSIAAQVTKLEKSINEEKKHKLAKEREGSKYIKEAREELQKLCKVLLQKKLENEDLKAEKEALLLEIELLVQNCDQCKDKCRNKQESVEEEIKAIDKEIADFKVRCTQCHKCIDTADVRKFCTDCPKCLAERNCLDEGDHCNVDHAMDCVCMTVKQKFMDNVFDNMYTSLEREVQTGPGKAVAEEVVKCLKKSRNGKLNEGTRKILQDFILTTVKKNLNLTIVGGAVKTRCEMDAETYKQLMLCLKQVKIAKPPKTDKGTEAKKEPCKRWGGASECNCPKGPNACICIQKAPPPVNEPSPCPPQPADKDDPGEVVMCPHKDSTPCGPDCAMHSIPNAVGSEVAAWRPSPCRGPTCQFTNMRAAQCVLGPEILTSARDPITQPPFSPTTSILDDQVACRCSGVPQIPCICHKDSKQMKVEIPISCDKETYAVGQKSVVFQQINEDTDKFNIDNIPVQETHSKLVNNEQKVTIRSIKNVLDNVSPIVTKTSSGELEVALDKEIVKLIDKKMQDSPNLSVEFNNNKVLAKKSPSGNIILEFDKKAKKKCLLHFEKSLNKVKTQSCNSDKNLSQKKLTKIILDTTNKKISGCKTRSKNITNFFKVTVKSNNHTANELVLALRQTDSGVYEVILDKEFKKWYKQAINDHCLGTEDEYARIERTSSGNFILNFGIDDQDYSESKYALLVKSHSGNNIKIVVDEQESKFEIMKKKFGSTISLRALSGLLNKLTYSNEEIQRKDSKKSRTISTKSSSDSNVYEKVKFDINNNQNLIESEAVLKKSESGKYTVVLNKESKSAFINNLGKTISSSSKGLIPIKQTVSGNITVSLNTDLTSQYGSLKITKSGNMYVLLNKNKAKGISTINESLDNKNVNKGTKLYQNSNQTKTVTSKATTTSCKGQCKENSCNESKCICDSISYDSKECVIENAEIFFENKEFANNTKDKDFISKDKLIKNLPHIVIKPCGCRSTSEKFTIDRNYNKVQSTRCPGHIDRYQELSNEILEISNPCQRDLDDIEKNEKTVKNRIVTHDNKKIDDWDSLQFLPPQLPPFLKDYSLL